MKTVSRARSRVGSRPLRWRVAYRFTSYSRQRGSEMAREQRVAIEEGNEARVLAHVRDGPALFVVHLAAIRRELQVACTCPVFALGRDACRHVWAALVATDRAHHLRSLRDFELVRAGPTSRSGG